MTEHIACASISMENWSKEKKNKKILCVRAMINSFYDNDRANMMFVVFQCIEIFFWLSYMLCVWYDFDSRQYDINDADNASDNEFKKK